MLNQSFFERLSIPLVLPMIIMLSSCSDDDTPQVVAPEGIFINEVYAAGNDWLELYNEGESSRNIGGYLIYDNASIKYALPANTTIPGRGFLVLICDDSGTGLNTNFKLTSEGETVYLENPGGELIDKVEFPALNDGQSYGRYPDGSPSLLISGNVSQGMTNGDTQAPAISNTTRTPLVPSLSDAVTIKTEFVATTGITSVKLFYRLSSGTFTETAMSLSSGFYTGTIPAQNTTGRVEYYIQAKNSSNKTALDPFDAPSDTYNFLLNNDALPALFINEFMAANTSCCPDTDSGTDEFDDWIEIYNAGSEPVNIGGMYLSDNKANPFKDRIPNDDAAATTIPPGGFLLLWADGSTDQGTLHLDFSLANSGEDIGIYYIDGREIDAYTFGTQTANKSAGRSPDGSSTWTIQTPSPGSSNDE